jgi:hypothetical protein
MWMVPALHSLHHGVVVFVNLNSLHRYQIALKSSKLPVFFVYNAPDAARMKLAMKAIVAQCFKYLDEGYISKHAGVP